MKSPGRQPTLLLDPGPDPVPLHIPYSELGTLIIPQEYQREQIKGWVFELARVLMAGGKCPAPFINERPDGRRVIVDGQQRWWAHMQAGLGMNTMLYRLSPPVLENEKKLYQIANYHVLQLGDNIVSSWPGPIAVLLRHWIGLSGSPYHGRTSLGRRGGAAYSASILARSICAMLTTSGGALGNIRRVLDRADAALGASPGAEERADAVLRLLPLIFTPEDRVRLVCALAVSNVARDRWATAVTGHFPKPKEQQRIRQINWPLLAPGYGLRHLPTLQKAVDDRWRTGAR
jgi:hypothetical protein